MLWANSVDMSAQGQPGCWRNSFHFLSLSGHRSAIGHYQKEGELDEFHFSFWGPGKLILSGSSVSSRPGRRQPSLSFLSLCVWQIVLVWFQLGVLGLISGLCSFGYTRPSDFYCVLIPWPWELNFLVAEYVFYSGTPSSNFWYWTIGQLGFGCWLLWVAVMLHGIIRIRCVPVEGWLVVSGVLGVGLDTSDHVWSLQLRLSEYIKSSLVEITCCVKMAHTSAKTDIVDNIVQPVPQTVDICPHGGSVNGQAQVLVELLRHVPPLSPEKPENILHFFIRLQEIYNLHW